MDEIYTSQNFNTFDPDKYFAEYHYHEVYDPNKYYTPEGFVKDYGLGAITYKFMLFTVRNSGGKFNDYNKKYIVAKEYLFDDEREKLAKYCPCPRHNNKLSKNKAGKGCLVDGNVHVTQEAINKARRMRDSRLICNLF